jgi:hypothetical protein
MSVPRFSAAASLYRTSGYYRTSAAFNQAGGIVFHSILKFFQVDKAGMFRMTSTARYFK